MAILGAVLTTGCESSTNVVETKVESVDAKKDVDSLVSDLVHNEELIREINPQLKKLTESVLNLQIVNNDLFSADCVLRDVVEIGTPASTETSLESVPVTFGELAAAKENIWRPLFEDIHFFDHAKLYAIRVTDRKSLPQAFESKIGFEAVGRTTQNRWRMIQGKGKIVWNKAEDQTWKVKNWDFQSLKINESESRFFEDVTTRVMSHADAKLARRSGHFEHLMDAILTGSKAFRNKREGTYYRHVPSGQHPSLSIVDIDGDGWDDIYLTEQWRKNMLFRNQGDGTFVESASEFNLDVDRHSTSSIFADFDNDGDQDLLLGRSLSPSMYLENQDGKFIDRTDNFFPGKPPQLVSSMSASDVNGDGLLDVYISTYGFPSGAAKLSDWAFEFLSAKEALELTTRFDKKHNSRFLNAIGPPNLLLVNQGGRLELSKFNNQVRLQSNSLQATFADYDSDGDQDLYISNDFAPDYLFRNDRESGFVDVTKSVGDETMMGFGMGASWGDFNVDGKQDLYVSNMYSKAGIRITEHFDGLDKRFRRSADGNRLYQFEDDKLKLVSANEGDGLNVHKAGWSWGGQFVDFNNDCFLDLYVSAGYFTAPKVLATDKDL